ncbi:hypothetical protein ACFX2I_023329 [Malus domestica]
MASRDRVPRDCELLIPVADSGDKDALSKPSSSSSSSHHTGHECVLFPIAITFYIAWWYIHFVNSFFFPIHAQLGINIFDMKHKFWCDNPNSVKTVSILREKGNPDAGPGFVNMHSGSSLHPLSLRAILEMKSCVYVPTNHHYIGDVFLVNTKDVIRPNLSVWEGIGE